MSFGGRSRADTANQIASKRRRAELRRCPKCGRGSALRDYQDDTFTGQYCYWSEQGKCDYKNLRERGAR